MAQISDEHDMEDFLKRVDELQAVVSGDVKVTQDDIAKTRDEEGGARMENKKAVDRTVFNRDAFKTPASMPPQHMLQGAPAGQSGNPAMDTSQGGFMKAVERDAEERYQRRQEGKRRATEWKEKGNAEFKEGNYGKAAELYTEGLQHLKDFGVLYTNRAQAYNKLGRFDEAIADCDLILRLEPKNSKAHVHRGKALLGLGKYDEAIESYREILTYDLKQGKMVNKYVSEVEQARNTAEAEERAFKRLQDGDMHSKTMTEVLDKLWKVDQNPMYYAGGMRVLADMIRDDNTRTLFRTGKGFDLLGHNTIQSCITQVSEGEKRPEYVEAVISLLDLLKQVVIQNDENGRLVVESADFPALFLGLLGCGNPDISQACITLLLKLTESPTVRQRTISAFNNESLLVGLFAFVQTSQTGSSEAAKVLNNLALEKKFTAQFRNKMDKNVLPAFEKFLRHHGSSKKSSVFPSCISFMGNMAHDPVIRKHIAERKEFWDATISVFKSHSKKMTQPANKDAVFSMLGLLKNISMEITQAFKDQSEALSSQLLPLLKCGDPDVQERAAGLLARALPHSTGAVQGACESGAPLILLQALQYVDADLESKAALSRCLTVLTQTSEEARKQVAEADPDLSCFRNLLSTNNDTITANVALSMGHCAECPGVSERLTETDIVKTLLSKTDTSHETIKQNCAITLAKLATSNQRHLDRLRELGGIGILHSCSKYALR